jgi:uncharacterized protein (DUF2147 family)
MPKAWPVALTIVCLSGPALAADVTGDWFVAKKTAVIRVTPCGTNMCGYIGWTKDAPPGATDKNNPDPAKRTRPVIGLEMITMKAAGKNRYEGEIYNGEEGKTYTGSIALVNDTTLRIEGCVLGFLCGGETWTRAKCDDPPPAPAAPPASARPNAPAAGVRAAPVAVPPPPPNQPLTGCRAAGP